VWIGASYAHPGGVCAGDGLTGMGGEFSVSLLCTFSRKFDALLNLHFPLRGDLTLNNEWQAAIHLWISNGNRERKTSQFLYKIHFLKF
jgi:hypothetical protein